jgi:hypothetical protein
MIHGAQPAGRPRNPGSKRMIKDRQKRTNECDEVFVSALR